MLTDRQLLILKTVVQLYEKHGEPVGSKSLMDRDKLDYSSATIRNDMLALEKIGLLEKMHTSSGRIPSEQGYRYYVDLLLGQAELGLMDSNKSLQMMIFRSLNNPFQSLDDIIDSSAKILSYLTKYTSFVLGPGSESNRLLSFRMAPIGNRQMVAIIVTDNGEVENLVFNLPTYIDYSDMLKMIAIVEEELVGHSLEEVYRRLNNDIPKLIQRFASNAQDIFDQLIAVFQQTNNHRLHMSGEMNVIDYLGSGDLQHFKAIHQLLDNNHSLMKLLQDNTGDGITIRIGEELDAEALADFSLITAGYEVKDHGSGLLAVLGPRNMAYQKNIELIRAFQDVLPVIIEKYYRLQNS